MTITPTEYQSRQASARTAMRQRGFDALLAWARGASTQDHAADVLYLTGHYTPQAFVPDTRYPESTLQAPAEANWRWRAAGHAAVIIPWEGLITLLTDSVPRTDSPAIADRVIPAADLIAAVSEILADCMHRRTDSRRQGRFRIAILGSEALAARWPRALSARLAIQGEVELVEADDLAWELRIVKSAAEQSLMRAAGALGAKAMSAAMRKAAIGATEAEIIATCIAEVIRGGGAWYGGGLSSGEWADSFAPTGREYGAAPSTLRTLEAGDLVRFDVYGSLAGYVFDFARSFIVGRPPTREQQLLLDAVQSSVQAGIERLRPGVTLGAVARVCQTALANSEYASRYGIPEPAMGGVWGHGLGLGFEPPWITADSQIVIEAGMCFAVELRIEAHSRPANARGAQYEDNVLVSLNGAELLTSVALG